MSEPIDPCTGLAAARPRLALVLPGGGARAAYQVGVLKALAELVPAGAPVPFRIISGTSAGAIIGCILAAHAGDFRQGVVMLERFVCSFRVEQVYRADAPSMLRGGLHWLLALLSGGWLARAPRSVLDNGPLRALLERHVNFAHIAQALEQGHLDAVSISASPYHHPESVAFYAAAAAHAQSLGAWPQGVPAELCLDHLMASAAMPFLFPSVRMDGEYYGDGAMRQVAPLATAIHLGADRLLAIGVRPLPVVSRSVVPAGATREPSFGQIFGFMLDTLFMDAMHVDLERLQRDNLLIAAAGGAVAGMRHIEALQITPREDFGEIAERHAADMPRALRTLLRTMGAANPGGRMLLSYLLFDGAYARELIALGYADALQRRDALQALLSEA
ncbi:MAG: patatin-like phospholipase family protein [Proteobacteria bacterium]|nr:patatin-like phospholipase family protein [Pseudomonadota bacterium]